MESIPKANILLVDDGPENLMALEALLEGLGQNLVQATSGPEALKCMLDQDFALILLDVQMPGMDGFETAALIRQRQRSRTTPILFLTAFSTSQDFVYKGYSLGAVDYLFKPLEPEILLSKVNVFVELYQKTAEIAQQAKALAAMNTELRQSESRFRTLSACSPVGIFLIDTFGQCIYANPRCEVIFGSVLNQDLVASWQQLVDEADRATVIADWITQLDRMQEYSSEFRVLTSQGLRWVHVRSSPMLSDQLGKLVGHVATVEDITEHKQAEAERAALLREQVARQQAEAANRMKDEFLGTLSHELRTPLNSMLGWAKLLRTKKFDETTTAKALETIERNARSQSQLVEDILDLSRIITGKLRLSLYPVPLIPIIESVVTAMQPAAEAKSIVIETVLEPKADMISGDPDRVEQILLNLLSNAVKFTPEGGAIEVQLQVENDYAQVSVRDTGIGIEPEFLPYVFDRFRQADSTTTRPHGGLGLGLSIVRHLVELHHGKVEASSEGAGLGATFVVRFALFKRSTESWDTVPLSDPGDPVPHDANEISPEIIEEIEEVTTTSQLLSNLRVLVVDDEPDARELLTVVLEQSGATVFSASSASDALAIIETEPLDMLVSDIGMPDEDGHTLIRKVRSSTSEQAKTLPAIALTAYVRDRDRNLALDAGFQQHFPKPVDTREFVLAVAKLAGRNTEVFPAQTG